MRRTIALALLLASSALADEADLAVVVEGAGPVALEAGAVLDHFGVEAIDLDSLHVLFQGEAVPYEVEGAAGGVLSRGDVLLFRSTGPSSRATRRTSFFVRRGAGIPVRFEEAAATNGPAGGRDSVRVEVVLEEDRRRATFEDHLFDLAPGVERDFWAAASSGGDRTVELALPRPPEGPVRLAIELVGDAPGPGRATAEVAVAGRRAGRVSLAAGERAVVEAEVDAAADGRIELRLESFDPGPRTRVWLDRVRCEYRTPARVEGSLAFVVREAERVRFGQELRVWDLDRRRSRRLPPGGAATPLEPGRYLAFTPGGRLAPVETHARRGADLLDPAGGADWIAIVPDAFAAALEPLAEHRRAEGLRVRVVPAEAIYDAFGEGEFGAEAIRAFLVHASRQWPGPRPRFVLLAADATRDVDRYGPHVIPTWTVETYLNGETASDNPYADLDGDHLPDLAIGRFPARTAEELAHLARRTVEYETGPLPGEWSRRVRFVTGEGRFGGGADQLLESVFKRLVTDLIPDPYDVDITFASANSPYLYAPSRLNDRVIDQLNDGSLFYVYVGHGYAKGFDSLRWEGRRHPILTVDHLPRIDVDEGMPIVVVLACTTGAFDDPVVDSIGEGLVRRPRGPVAFLGSSRVSHPYPMGIMARDLIDLVFAAGSRPRLGEVVAEAKRRMVGPGEGDAFRRFVDFSARLFVKDGPTFERLRADHAYLFNLLGDPALSVRVPRRTIDLVPTLSGADLEVTGLVETLAGGRLEITLESMRDQILHTLEPPDTEEKILRNYARANDKVVARSDGPLDANPFRRVLAVPADLPPGTYLIKAWAQDEKGRTALGATRIRLER